MARQYNSGRATKNRRIAGASLPGPCSICGHMVTADMNWDCDHIVPRIIAEQAGWTQEQIDAPTNLSVSHRSCNVRSGAKLGNRLRAEARKKKIIQPVRRPQPVAEEIAEPQSFFCETTRTPAAAPRFLSPNGEESPLGGTE